MWFPHHRRYLGDVATAGPNASLREIASLLHRHAVGCVVVVDEDRRPLGMVTDRDLTCRVIAKDLDPEKTRAGDVMTRPLVTGSPDESLEDLVEHMRSRRIRRLPILEDGRVAGIVTLDDVLVVLSRELSEIGEAARMAVTEGRKHGRREGRREDLEKAWQNLRDEVQHATQEAREFLAEEMESLRERARRLLRSDEKK